MNAMWCGSIFRSSVAALCIVCLVPGEAVAFAFQSKTPAATSSQSPKIPPDQLDSLVAPIALYPDPLLAQVLAASTYPLEIVQLQQWLEKNKSLKDKALADAVAKQPWDASVQALAPLPEAIKLLAGDIGWTTDLGNAFLAQQSDVMDAVQRMRKKAQDKGALKTTEQQKVETTVVENKQVIIIQPASTQVVYVPTYDPIVVYGPPVYPYPPGWYYPAGIALSFGYGMMMGAFWAGGWGWGCGWGGSNIYINRDNNFNRNTNINRPSQLPSGGRGNIGGPGGVGGVGGVGGAGGVGGVGGAGGVGGVGGPGGANRPSQLPAGGAGGGAANRPSQQPAGGGGRDTWQHNPQHRGGAPYRDRATADRFGGSARGDSLAQRQASARQQISRQGGSMPSTRGLGAGSGNRGGAGVSNRASGLGGGPDRIGSRDLSRTGGGNRDAFGGGNRDFNGASARNSSNRGMSSMSSRGGGGFSRGGGGGRRR
jgi:hypothetical protein